MSLLRTLINRSLNKPAIVTRFLCTAPSETTTPTDKQGGYAKAFTKFENLDSEQKVQEPIQTFASLLSNSKFVDVCIKYNIYS